MSEPRVRLSRAVYEQGLQTPSATRPTDRHRVPDRVEHQGYRYRLSARRPRRSATSETACVELEAPANGPYLVTYGTVGGGDLRPNPAYYMLDGVTGEASQVQEGGSETVPQSAGRGQWLTVPARRGSPGRHGHGLHRHLRPRPLREIDRKSNPSAHCVTVHGRAAGGRIALSIGSSTAMYRSDISACMVEACRHPHVLRAAALRCSSSPSSACSMTAPCTATSCASGSTPRSASFRALSYGSLYPACASCSTRAGSTRPREAADARPSKRARIVYELTADGKEHFQDLVAASGPDAWDDDDFDVRFAFFARTEARGPAAHPRGPALTPRGASRRTSARPPRHTASGWTATPSPSSSTARSAPSARSAGSRSSSSPNARDGPRPRTPPAVRRHHQRHPPPPRARPPTTRSDPWDPFASPSSASATARARWSRASSTTGTPTRPPAVPGLMHVKFGDYHVARRRVRRRVRRRRQEGRHRPVRGHRRLARTTPSRSPTSPPRASRSSAATPSTASASTTARRSTSRTPSRSTSCRSLKDRKVDVLVSYLPVGSEEADKFYAQCAIDAEGRLRQRAAGLHRLRPRVGREVRGRRRADHR